MQRAKPYGAKRDATQAPTTATAMPDTFVQRHAVTVLFVRIPLDVSSLNRSRVSARPGTCVSNRYTRPDLALPISTALHGIRVFKAARDRESAPSSKIGDSGFSTGQRIVANENNAISPLPPFSRRLAGSKADAFCRWNFPWHTPCLFSVRARPALRSPWDRRPEFRDTFAGAPRESSPLISEFERCRTRLSLKTHPRIEAGSILSSPSSCLPQSAY